MTTTTEEKLSFSEAKQDALLGHLLEDESLFMQCRGSIRPKWFANAFCQKIWRAKKGLYEEWQRVPTLSEVKECKSFKMEDQSTRVGLEAKFAQIANRKKEFHVDGLANELTEWMHAQIFKKSMTEAITTFNKADMKQTMDIVSRTVKEIQQISFEKNNEIVWPNFVNIFTAQQQERENACTIGISSVDELLDPQCEVGSLLPGDRTTILAPTNVGKTTFLITVALANAMQGKKVLFLSHEGKPEDLILKMFCRTMRLKKGAFFEAFDHRDAYKSQFDQALRVLENHLVYIPMNKPRLTVEEVEGEIYRAQDRCISRLGSGFDLILDDYPAKLFTSQNMKGNLTIRDKDDIVYDTFTQLALKMKVHVMDAIQTNREGSKINKRHTSSEKRLLTMEDVKESWGPMTTATNVISLNRSPEDEAHSRIVLHICKSRSNEKGWSVICRSDYASAATHGENLGCTWYKGSATMSETVEMLLQQFSGQRIPPEALGV